MKLPKKTCRPLIDEHELQTLLDRHSAPLQRAFEANFGFKRDAVHFYSIKKAVQALLEANLELESTIGHTTLENIVGQLCEIPMRPEVLRTVVPHITVYETYFFRHPEHFEWLRTTFLPELKARKRAARDFDILCWSAGCSTGEEAYSLAIVLSECFTAQEGWNVKVIATDINPVSLDIARKGCYGEWSFRNVPSTVRSKFFSPCDNERESVRGLPGISRCRVDRSVQGLVSFSELNLHVPQWDALNAELSERTFDIIFCRNVLIYLHLNAAKTLVARFTEKLASHGVLVVGPSEPWLLKDTALIPHSIPGGSVFFKEENSRRRATQQSVHSAWAAASLESTTRTQASPVAERAPQKIVNALAIQTAQFSPENTHKNTRERAIQRARQLADSGETEQALGLISELLKEETTNAELYYLRGVALLHKGDSASAESDIKKSLFIEPDNIVAYIALASIAKAQGNLREMKKHYSNALYYLSKINETDIVPDSDGIPAQAMRDMVESLMANEGLTANKD